MCGRFIQRYTWREIHDHYDLAPTDTVDVVKLANGGTMELVPMRWVSFPTGGKSP
jgi:putative SOS response-associated peptidase YedK